MNTEPCTPPVPYPYMQTNRGCMYGVEHGLCRKLQLSLNSPPLNPTAIPTNIPKQADYGTDKDKKEEKEKEKEHTPLAPTLTQSIVSLGKFLLVERNN